MADEARLPPARPAYDGAGAAGHLLFGLLLFTGLTLPTLQPFGEGDRWLGIGAVMVTVGLATWLPLSLILPAVALVWGLPFLVAELGAVETADRPVPWTAEATAQLLGLLFLGCGVAALYRGRPSTVGEYRTPIDEPAGTRFPAIAAGPGSVARGPSHRLDASAAETMLLRLALLRRDLWETSIQLRVSRALSPGPPR